MQNNYSLVKENMNYAMLFKVHALGMDQQSPFSRYNQPNGDLSGNCRYHLEPTPEHLAKYNQSTGFHAINYYAKDILGIIAGLDTEQRNAYFAGLNKDLRTLAHQAFPHHSGSVTYFDWGGPKIYIFSNPQDPLTPVYTPSFNFHKAEEERYSTVDDKDDEYQSALDPASQHMLQARLQQEAEHGHNDDNDEPKPTKPTPPTDDDNSSLQQAIKQQDDAVNDDDDDYDNKKKRERRQQRQRRTKQRLTQEQQQDNEARIIRERCLAAEKKYNEELKHPTKPYNNGNRSTNKPEPDGPSM